MLAEQQKATEKFCWSAILQLLFTPETLLYFGLDLCNTDKTVDYNTERKVLSVRENRTKCIIIIGFLYKMLIGARNIIVSFSL